jgi:hypothetical protein
LDWSFTAYEHRGFSHDVKELDRQELEEENGSDQATPSVSNGQTLPVTDPLNF